MILGGFYGSWQFLVFIGGSWWFLVVLMVLGGPWCFLVVLGDSWRFLVVPVSYWSLFLAIDCGSWLLSVVLCGSS